MTVAFHAWNPFQVFQIANIARAYEDSVLLLEKRSSMDFERVFDSSILEGLGIPVVETTARQIAANDGEYAAIVVQTPIRFFERLEKTKRVAVQYSITKERHQHGAWRALCDLNLLYGAYSYERCAPLSPCRMIGNPRFEQWFEGKLDQEKLARMRESLDPSKKTVLYQPTWGDLSSVPMFQNAVGNLSEQYNVIAKVHHNTDALELDRKTALGASGLDSIFGASDDSLYLLACADMVLSDYSGAMFDALNVGKPVVLLQHEPENLSRSKFGLESIEYARRDDIGPVAGTPEVLREVVDEAFARPEEYRERNRLLKAECFALETGCSEAAAEALTSLLNDQLEPRSYYQVYLRDELLEGREASEKLRTLTARKTLLERALKKAKKSRKGRRIPWYRKPALAFTRLKTKIRKSILNKVEKKASEVESLDLPVSLQVFSRLVPAFEMVALSKKLAANGKTMASVKVAVSASARKDGPAFAHLVTIAGRAKDDALLAIAKTHFEQMSGLRRGRYGRNTLRLAEALGEDVQPYLAEAQAILTENITKSGGSMRSRYLSLRSMIRQRELAHAEELMGQVRLKVRDSRKLEVDFAVLRARSGKWFQLIDLATANALGPNRLCVLNGEVLPIEDVPGPKVEFLVPPYFGDVVSGSDPSAHERICAFLRGVLDEIKNNGIAIVPKHQYWLHIANPTGDIPAISYHTMGEKNDWLHLKDAAIPGYYRVDPKGYAGFSSFADLVKLPSSAMLASKPVVDAIWEEVLDATVRAKASKYAQVEQTVNLPDQDFIFFALQMLDDTVARLAWVPMIEGLQAVVDHGRRVGKPVVIKRHPMCKRQDVSDVLSEFGGMEGVLIADASIHDILPRAETVVTVNSGVGFEALLYGKNVITLGASEYGVVTKRCHTLAELEAALIASDEPDMEAIQRFVWFYMDNCVRGDDVSKISRWIAPESGEKLIQVR